MSFLALNYILLHLRVYNNINHRVCAQNESQWKSDNFERGVKVRERSGNSKAMGESQGKSGNFISTTKHFFSQAFWTVRKRKKLKKIDWLPAFHPHPQVNFCISLTLLSDLPPQQKNDKQETTVLVYILHMGLLLSGHLTDNIKTDSKSVRPFWSCKEKRTTTSSTTKLK